MSRYFETTQVSKEIAATEEAKGAAKKTTVAHDAVLGFPLDPEGFCLLAENNTPGGSALFKPFLKHLLVLGKKRDPQERVKQSEVRAAHRFFRRHSSECFVCLANTASHIYRMLANVGTELFGLLQSYMTSLPKEILNQWPEEKTASFRMSTGAIFTISFATVTPFDRKIDKLAKHVYMVASVNLKFAIALPNLIFALIKDRRVEDFLPILKYMKKPFRDTERSTLILGTLTNKIKFGTNLKKLFLETSQKFALRIMTSRRRPSWGMSHRSNHQKFANLGFFRTPEKAGKVGNW